MKHIRIGEIFLFVCGLVGGAGLTYLLMSEPQVPEHKHPSAAAIHDTNACAICAIAITNHEPVLRIQTPRGSQTFP